jgi:hypothetical protein
MAPEMLVDILYAVLQVHGIVNVALHQEYSPGRISIMAKTNTWSNSNEYH